MLAPIGILTQHSLGASVKKVRKPSGLRPPQQLRQLGDVGGDAARLGAGEQIGGRAAAGVTRKIHIGERLPVLKVAPATPIAVPQS
jgi:hypothetical protein